MIVEGDVLHIPRANIDTDQIIPARFLTGITSEGTGRYCFAGLPGGEEYLASRPAAVVLVCGENFGCGSSREHAAWALRDRGFGAIVAPSFARIFLENAYNNAIVPITLPAAVVARISAASRMHVDVEAQTLRADGGDEIAFALDAVRKPFLVGGGYLKFIASKIPRVRAWESARTSQSVIVFDGVKNHGN